MPDAALDATAEALTRRILGDLPPDRPRTRDDLARLPAPVAALLSARLDGRADAALPSLDSSWIDPDAPAFLDAARAWQDAVRAAARFPAEAWADAVEDAVQRALAHLVRPAAALVAWAFRDEADTLPAAAALRRARAFGPYPYLPAIAERYVERKGLEEVGRDELEEVFRRIDRRMVSTFGADDWGALLGPLYDLAGPVGAPAGTVPASLLRALFRARGADALADALPDEPLDLEALRRLATGILEPAPEPSAVPVIEEPAPPGQDAQEVFHDEEGETEDEARPVEEEPAEEPTPEPLAAPATDAPAPDAESPDAETPDALAEASASEPSEAEAEPAEVSAEAAAISEDEVDAPAANSPSIDEPEAGEAEPEEAEPASEADWDLPGSPLPVAAPEPAPIDDDPKSHRSDRPSLWLLRRTEKAPTDAQPPPPEPAAHEVEGPEPIEPPAVGAPESAEPDSETTEPTLKTAQDLRAPRPESEEPAVGGPPSEGPEEALHLAPLRQEETPASKGRSESPTSAPAEPGPAEPGQTAPEEPAPPAQRHAELEEMPQALSGQEEPLWRRLARQHGGAAEELPPEPDNEEVPLWRRFVQPESGAPEPDAPAGPSPAEPAPKAASTSLDDLERRVLGEGAAEHRRWYVETLFDGSMADYRETLATLDRTQSWTEATQIIARDVFRKHRVDLYSEPAVAFTDAVEARVAGRGGLTEGTTGRP